MASLESPVSLRSGNPIRWDLRYLLGNVFVEYGVLVFGAAKWYQKIVMSIYLSDGLVYPKLNPSLFRVLEVPWRNGFLRQVEQGLFSFFDKEILKL